MSDEMKPMAWCNHLEAYADSYAQMSRDGDGRVDCRSVEVDIRQNMMPVVAALVAERDEARTERDHWKTYSSGQGKLISSGVFVRNDEYIRLNAAENALAEAQAEVERLRVAGARLALAAENFARRFGMNDLAEDDDRQRQAVVDQVRLFRSALKGGENDR